MEFPRLVYKSAGRHVAAHNAEEFASLIKDGWYPSVPEALGQAPALREDGPDIYEFVAAGGQAKDYPPAGYTSRSTPEEIAAVASAQAPVLNLGAQPAPEDAPPPPARPQGRGRGNR